LEEVGPAVESGEWIVQSGERSCWIEVSKPTRGEIPVRKPLDDALVLYEGMNEAGRAHWRERAVPSIRFESAEERSLFLENLDRIDRGEELTD
jgi:hypothetical protein